MSDQNLYITFNNTTPFELRLRQKIISHGEWGNEPPETIPPQQVVKISAGGKSNLQGYFIYVTADFGEDHPLAVMWRYQADGKPGRMVTASRENFEVEPPFSDLRVPTADVDVKVFWLER